MRAEQLNNKFEGSGGLRGRTIIGCAGFDPRRHQPGGSLAGRTLDKCARRSAGHSMSFPLPPWRRAAAAIPAIPTLALSRRSPWRGQRGHHGSSRPGGRERRRQRLDRRRAGRSQGQTRPRQSRPPGEPDGTIRLYYEPGSVRAGSDPEVQPGERHFVKIARILRTHKRWEIRIDGNRIGHSFTLGQGWTKLRAVATAESWDGGTPTCNHFLYAFGKVKTRGQHGWRGVQSRKLIQDPGYMLLRSHRARFVATNVSASDNPSDTRVFAGDWETGDSSQWSGNHWNRNVPRATSSPSSPTPCTRAASPRGSRCALATSSGRPRASAPRACTPAQTRSRATTSGTHGRRSSRLTRPRRPGGRSSRSGTPPTRSRPRSPST